MATQVQLRRGTEAEQDLFTGAEGELTYSTDSKGLRIHDGATMGGFPVDVVVAFQRPTAENNYTWYRKYASGWVEQGGVVKGPSGTIVLPIKMASDDYFIIGNIKDSASGGVGYAFQPRTPTTTTIPYYCAYVAATSSGGATENFYWRVEGIAATASGPTGGYDDGGPSREDTGEPSDEEPIV